MQSFLPPEEISNIYALLAVIADPKAAKERLDKIVAAKAVEQKFRDEAVSLSKKASADKEDAAIMAADARKVSALHDALQVSLNAKAKEHADRESLLANKEASIRRADSDLASRMKAHDDAVAAHEDEVRGARADIAAKQAALAKASEEHKRKIEEFNKLMAPVMAVAGLAASS